MNISKRFTIKIYGISYYSKGGWCYNKNHLVVNTVRINPLFPTAVYMVLL